MPGLHLFAAAERVADAKKTATPRRRSPSSYAGSARLRKLSPIVTNLAAPANNWARVEASMVTDSMSDEDAGILAAHISEDIVDLSSVGFGRRSSKARAGFSICATT